MRRRESIFYLKVLTCSFLSAHRSAHCSAHCVFFWLLLGLAIAGAVWFLAGIVRVFLSEEFRVDVDRQRNERRSKRGKHLLLLGLLTVTLLLFSGLVSAQVLTPSEQQPRTFRIPFRTAVNGLILLDGKINGRPAVLLLDTGAGPNFATYEAAGLKPHEGVEDRHVEIAFGELRVTCPARIVHGLQSPKSDGTLGEDFLRRFSSVRIDFKSGVVELVELESAQ